jgi:uncharacterized membrane protein
MYEGILFLHLVGVAGLIVSLAFSLGGFFLASRAATVQEVRASLAFVTPADRAIAPAMLVLLASGLWMVGDANWGWGSGWVVVAIAVFVLMGIVGLLVEDPRIAAIRVAAAGLPDGPVPDELDTLRRDPLLTHVACFGASQLVAFLYLMAVKPGWAEATAAVLIAGALSVVPARAMLRARAGVRTSATA